MTDAAGRLSAALAGRYRIERELGQGGMATVYLAQDLKHDRKVAIKVLRPELAAVIGAERFLREIKTIANLQHPHILGLIDSGEVQGTAYYVMPFVEGESLRDRIAREKQLPIADAIRLATEVAAALDYAHRHGVIHRDIKPENVLLHDGSALVADFGIALAVSKSGGTRMTETGMSLGTPHYMSPEQAMGEREISARSDVYALGAMTYEMLTGDPPFTGSTAQAIVAKVMTEKPASIRRVRERVPEGVEEAVFTALEKLPADRYATAAEFAAALKEDGIEGTTRSRPAKAVVARSPRALYLASTIAVLATLAALALGVKLRYRPAPPVTRLTLDVPGLRVNHIGYYGNAIAIAPDGSRMAFVVGRGGETTRLAVRERGSLDLKILPGTEDADGPFFSPDGAWIGYYARGKVFKIPAAGGPPVQVATNAATILLFGAWGTDNTIVYSTPAFALMAVPAAGGTPRQLVPTPLNGGAGYPALLPRKDALLLTRCGNNCAQPVIMSFNLKTQRMDTLLAGGVRAFYLPNGMLVVVRFDGTVVGAPFDLDRLRFTREPAVLLTGVQLELGLIPELAIADDGTLVYLPSNATAGTATVAEVTRDGRSRVLDPGWMTRFSSLTLSPDGQRLAVSFFDGTSGHLWVKQLDNGPLTRLTFDGTINYRGAWLPDGRSLSFSSDRAPDGTTHLYRVRADGSDKPERLFPNDTSQIDEAVWSRDGQWMAYRVGVISGVRDVYARRVTGDTSRVTVAAGPADEYNPAISPDGSWIAYVSLESGREEVYVRPFPDVSRARWQVSPAGGTSPVWSHSGRELFYLAHDSLVAASIATAPDFRVVGQKALFSTTPFVFQPWHQAFGVRPGDQSFIMLKRPLDTGADARRLTVVLNWFGEISPKRSREE